MREQARARVSRDKRNTTVQRLSKLHTHTFPASHGVSPLERDLPRKQAGKLLETMMGRVIFNLWKFK